MDREVLPILWYAKFFSDAIRKCTKILKPIFGLLRRESSLSFIFVDDSYLQKDTEQECMNDIKVTVT